MAAAISILDLMYSLTVCAHSQLSITVKRMTDSLTKGVGRTTLIKTRSLITVDAYRMIIKTFDPIRIRDWAEGKARKVCI